MQEAHIFVPAIETRLETFLNYALLGPWNQSHVYANVEVSITHVNPWTFQAVNVASSLPALKSAFGKDQIDVSAILISRFNRIVMFVVQITDWSLFYCIKPTRIEELRKQIARVHEVMQDLQSTEFLIVTIPTVSVQPFVRQWQLLFCAKNVLTRIETHIW